MHLVSLSAESLSRELSKEIPATYVIIAKHDVYGMDSESIAEVLSCSVAEVEEVKADQVYKDVRLYIGAVAAQQRVDQSAGWDAIEGMAIENLIKRLPYEKDGDFLLRVAAVANRAQRRQATQANVLDPTRQNGKTVVRLTERLMQRFTQQGPEQVRERELSIHDGSMTRPSFDDVDQLLDVSRQRIAITTHTSEVDMDELNAEMQRRGS